MSDDIKDSVGKVIKERLSNPLWGYILLSWVPINWDSLAILFMSDAPVKFRLDYITLQPFHFLKFVIFPVVIGAILAVVTPYLQWLLARTHEWADKRHSSSINRKKNDDLNYIISSADLRAKAEQADKIARDKIDEENRVRQATVNADIIQQEERGKQSKRDTEILDDKIKSNNILIKSQEENIRNLLGESDRVKDQLEGLMAKVARILNKIDDLKESKTKDEMVRNYIILESLFPQEGIELAREEDKSKQQKKYFTDFIREREEALSSDHTGHVEEFRNFLNANSSSIGVDGRDELLRTAAVVANSKNNYDELLQQASTGSLVMNNNDELLRIASVGALATSNYNEMLKNASLGVSVINNYDELLKKASDGVLAINHYNELLKKNSAEINVMSDFDKSLQQASGATDAINNHEESVRHTSGAVNARDNHENS